MAGGDSKPVAGHTAPRKGPNFSARTAIEDGSRLDPTDNPTVSERSPLISQEQSARPGRSPGGPAPSSHGYGAAVGLFGGLFRKSDGERTGDQETNGQHDGHRVTIMRRASLSSQTTRNIDMLDKKEKTGPIRPSDNASEKLGTFSGVFVPTTLNVLSILMFLRFGFILGQSGVLGMLGMLIASYAINLVTAMSISAIATNGTVRGGGAYYLISRSLGPEFGGSIGIVFYLGSVFNTGMNAVGLVDCLANNFGSHSGNWYNFLREGFWWNYLWGTIVVVLCTAICLAGSSIFSRASTGLLIILLVATFSIPFSALFQKPFTDPKLDIEFTGLNFTTFMENLKPQLTEGAAGSETSGRETFQNLFGILFPATGGIFAGASMSGDLKHPSKAIPKGTLSGLGLTFTTYALVIVFMAATITRASLYKNTNVIQDTNLSAPLILLGEFATSFFSSLMGLIGAAKLLQAVARDSLLPGLSIFGQGTKKNDEPTIAIVLTFIVAQITMLFDINRIASFITMTYLMTFLATNLACFLLKVGSAPNFRPSFHYFNWHTAAAGALISGVCMFFVDSLYASGCLGVLVFLFLVIHYTSPPKTWGDVSQSLIYHQVRKYLLRLRQEHVKFWRPQILLFVNDYESQYKMIHFCNSLKKGALFVLGHVIVTQDFASAVPEARRKQSSWTKFVGFSKVKAFINVSVSPSAEWGMRNVVLNSGLGGMRPNIVIIDQFRRGQSLVNVSRRPTSRSRRDSRVPSFFERADSRGEADATNTSSDEVKFETGIGVKSYLTILEDLLFQLRINVAVAKGFEDLELPGRDGHTSKKYIDLWPIQMSAEIASDGGQAKQNVLTTNFDTYTLILQLGCILHTVPSWKKLYTLRVAVFVEYETDVEEERGRVMTLLDKLRIEAEVLVFWLASGELKSYQVIVNGEKSVACEDALQKVNSTLENEEWWKDMQNIRKTSGDTVKPGSVAKLLDTTVNWPTSSFQHSRHRDSDERFDGLKRFMQNTRRRRSVSSLGGTGVNLGMQTHRLSDAFVEYHADPSEESSSSESEEERWLSGGEEDSPETATPDIGGSSRPKFPYGLQEVLASSETALVDTSSSDVDSPSGEHPEPPQATASNEDGSQTIEGPSRPFPSHPSSNKFTSSPIPETRINTEEDTGPSIMFADDIPSPKAGRPEAAHHRESIYSRSASGAQPTQATGYPQQAAIPLGFNDLPCRAQHLILNELMVMHSSETAVAFTTLPSPMEGTWQDEAACESYVSDLEVLYQGLPPCLLVHSNSMTVTMNL